MAETRERTRAGRQTSTHCPLQQEARQTDLKKVPHVFQVPVAPQAISGDRQKLTMQIKHDIQTSLFSKSALSRSIVTLI